MEPQPSMKLDSLTLDPLLDLEPEPKTLTKEQLALTRAAAMLACSMQHDQSKLPGMKTIEEKPEKSNKPESEADVYREKGTYDQDPQPK